MMDAGAGTMSPVQRSAPAMRNVVAEQVRVAGLALRGAGIAAAAIAVLATLMVSMEILRGDEVIDFHPERWILPGLLGLVLPMAVWKGERRFDGGFLWTLPVERSRHAFAKVAGGWVWLMGAVALFVLWQLALTLLSGGHVLGEQLVRVISPDRFPVDAAVDPSDVYTVRWNPNPLLWFVPFTSATVTYAIASALLVGLRQPLRWIGGTLVGLVLLVGLMDLVGQLASSQRLIFAPSNATAAFFYGEYGLAALLTASRDLLHVQRVIPGGETVVVSNALPAIGRWAGATLLWGTVAAIALLAAIARHRERRRR